MKKILLIALIAGTFTLAMAAGFVATGSSTSSSKPSADQEIAALKEQVAELNLRVTKLENALSQQSTQKKGGFQPTN